MPIGTQAAPLLSGNCHDVAQQVLHTAFLDPAQGPLITNWRSEWFVYEEERWTHKEEMWIRNFLFRELGEAWVIDDPSKPEELARWVCTKAKVEEVVAFMAALTEVDRVMPGWLCGAGPLDPQWCIAFRNAVVSVEDGTVTLVERTSEWFDTAVIPHDWPEGGREAAYPEHLQMVCPRWMQCLQEWSGGDEVWIELLQRWMGYCLLGHRKYARWMLMKGEPRSGKGTIAWVLKQLLGDGGFISTSLYTLARDFGLHGTERARVLSVIEAADLETAAGERAAHTIKAIVGQDPVDVRRMYRGYLRNVTLDLAVMMQSNQVVRLPNKGRGLSDKMLVLPFERSFVGREDPLLKERLALELEGIAWWCVEGARRLAASEPGAWFPMPPQAEDEIAEYTDENNPMDVFLRDRFVECEGGFVPLKILWEQWLDWKKENHVRSFGDTGRQVFGRTVTENSTWRLRKSRAHGGVRGLRGLALRRTGVEW